MIVCVRVCACTSDRNTWVRYFRIFWRTDGWSRVVVVVVPAWCCFVFFIAGSASLSLSFSLFLSNSASNVWKCAGNHTNTQVLVHLTFVGYGIRCKCVLVPCGIPHLLLMAHVTLRIRSRFSMNQLFANWNNCFYWQHFNRIIHKCYFNLNKL